MLSLLKRSARALLSPFLRDPVQRQSNSSTTPGDEPALLGRHWEDVDMVETRRMSHALAEEGDLGVSRSDITSDLASKERIKVASHVEIVVSNKRRRLHRMADAEEQSFRSERMPPDDPAIGENVVGQGEYGFIQDIAVAGRNLSQANGLTAPLKEQLPGRERRNDQKHEALGRAVAIKDKKQKKRKRHDSPQRELSNRERQGKPLSRINGTPFVKKRTSVSKHIKFGEEAIGDLPVVEQALKPVIALEEDSALRDVEQSEEGDEGPETESLSVAHSKAKARVRDAVKAIERYASFSLACDASYI